MPSVPLTVPHKGKESISRIEKAVWVSSCLKIDKEAGLCDEWLPGFLGRVACDSCRKVQVVARVVGVSSRMKDDEGAEREVQKRDGESRRGGTREIR